MSLNQRNLVESQEFIPFTRLENGRLYPFFYHNFVYDPERKKYFGLLRSGDASINDNLLKFVCFNDSETIKIEYIKLITKGEDPRCFMFNNKPYGLTWDPEMISGRHVMSYKLIDILNESVIPLQIEDNDYKTDFFKFGKNWVPCELNGELYILLTISPKVIVVKCNPLTGKCKFIDASENTKLSVDSFRGGSNLLFLEDENCFIGLGHKTYDSGNHNPFLYSIDKNLTKFSLIKEFTLENRSKVLDPLSLWIENGKIKTCIMNWDFPYGGRCLVCELV